MGDTGFSLHSVLWRREMPRGRNPLSHSSGGVTKVVCKGGQQVRLEGRAWSKEEEGRQEGGQPGRALNSQVGDILDGEGSMAWGSHRWGHNQAKD